MTLAVLIRFKNSAATLPGVLAALRAQTTQPTELIGVDSGSTDGSDALIREAGGSTEKWAQPYHHSRCLNFGMSRCNADAVLILSSHTVLHDATTLATMLAALAQPGTACVSGKWTPSDDWSDAITWDELQRTGLRFCSIYSNSFGMIRRELWQQRAFDETIVTMEDYAWALDQVRAGHTCRRVAFPFSYQRSAHNRDFTFAAVTFHLARRHSLRVGWLGRKSTLLAILRRDGVPLKTHLGRLRASFARKCPTVEK
jgi:Glycosyl transferase family 2